MPSTVDTRTSAICAGVSWVRPAHPVSGLRIKSSQHARRILGDPCRGIPPRPGGKVDDVDLAQGTWVQANSGPHRCAYGELLRYTDEATMAYVRIDQPNTVRGTRRASRHDHPYPFAHPRAVIEVS